MAAEHWFWQNIANTMGYVGENVGIEGKELTPGTTKVMTIRKELNGVLVTIWDTPGLQDGTSREKEFYMT